MNIYQAARLAMRRAISKLANSGQRIGNSGQKKLFANRYSLNAIVLVDGKNRINKLNLEQIPIIKGDRKIFSIACASLIAKVFRDKMMIRYGRKFSEYEFEKHKGYGTKLHRAMLVRHGRSPIHRISFKLV